MNFGLEQSVDFGHVVMENHELVSPKGKCGARSSVVIAELYLDHAGFQRLNNSSDPASAKRTLGYVFKECNNSKWLDTFHFPTQNATIIISETV